MTRLRPSVRTRASAAAITAAIVVALGYALLAGLGVTVVSEDQPALLAFAVTPPAPPPPPPPPAPKPAIAPREEGAAAPPNLKSQATAVTAPVPIVHLTPPPPIPVALQPAEGRDTTSGNAAVVGPGPGSGGIGNGTGSGGAGNGPGGGGGTPPHRIGGTLSIRDVPPERRLPGAGGTVSVLYVVSAAGRVTDCEVTRSSGNAMLDDLTCRLIEQRFRFAPSRDAQGHPVESMVEENHSWSFD